MIEINLLPARQEVRGRSAGAGLGEPAWIFAKVKDPISSARRQRRRRNRGGRLLWLTQSARERSLVDKEQKAVQDSTRYATVVAEKRKAEAQRDSVLRQVNIIRAIDDDRFVWSHIMDEVSRVVPPYTWLVAIKQTSKVISPAAAPAPADPNARPEEGHDEDEGRGAMVDNRHREAAPLDADHRPDVRHPAMTRFMRLLESSPFTRLRLASSRR